MIRAASRQMDGKSHKKIKKVLLRGLVGAGVAAAMFSCVYMVNPSVTAQMPIVSHVFEQIGESLDFAGDYAAWAEQVKEAEKGIESITVDGTTITLSESYCNETALYLSLIIHSEEKFPDTFYDENGKPMINMYGQIDVDFDEEGAIDLVYVGDSEIDGKMMDDNTFAGVIRQELNDINENGLGIISVTKTPMDSSVEMVENLDCYAAVLDADGNLMGSGVPGYGNTAPVYVCDYEEYMDELDDVWWSGGYDESVRGEVFKESLDERSLYRKEIIFDE